MRAITARCETGLFIEFSLPRRVRTACARVHPARSRIPRSPITDNESHQNRSLRTPITQQKAWLTVDKPSCAGMMLRLACCGERRKVKKVKPKLTAYYMIGLTGRNAMPGMRAPENRRET